jgi:hypothetical protein
VPWDDVPPGYGRHQVEYRAIDASGNIGTPRRFVATLVRPTCGGGRRTGWERGQRAAQLLGQRAGPGQSAGAEPGLRTTGRSVCAVVSFADMDVSFADMSVKGPVF